MKTAHALLWGLCFSVLASPNAALAGPSDSGSAVERKAKSPQAFSRKMALWSSLGSAVVLGLGGFFLWSVSETKSPPSQTSEFQFPPLPDLPPIPPARTPE